jgi:hypothetical protein
MIMISKQISSIIVIALTLVYAAKPSIAKHEQINKLVSTSYEVYNSSVLGNLISSYSFLIH